MKTLVPLTAFVALAASGFSSAQSTATAYSKPSGYVTQTLEANSFNLVGITLQGSVLYSGSFEIVNGTTLTDNQASFTPTAGRTYILEITSDNNEGVDLNGVIQEVPAASLSGTTVRTTDNLQASGLLSGATYTICLAPTIEEVFGTTTSVLSKGPNSGSSLSDVIWIPDGPGDYTRYYIRSSDSTVRNATSNAAAPNVQIIYSDGLLVQKKNTGSSILTLTGRVKTSSSQVVVRTGFNPLGTTFPAGATLQNLGLENTISKGPNSGSSLSDIVWIPIGSGDYDRYYCRSSDNSWRNATTNALAPSNLAITSAILLQRKGASIMVKLSPPSTYSSL